MAYYICNPIYIYLQIFHKLDFVFVQHQGDKEMTCPALYIQDFQQDEFFPRFDQTPNKASRVFS